MCWGLGSFSTVALNFGSEVHVLTDVISVWSQHAVSYPQLNTTQGTNYNCIVQVRANLLPLILFSFYHDLFFFLFSLVLSLIFFIKKVSYLAHKSPVFKNLHIFKNLHEALGLPSTFWQIPSADGNF